MNIHAKGNKLKLLFSYKGQLSMQDLYDLPTDTLRKMANILNRGLKQADDLFATVSREDSLNKLRLDIILDVLENREAEVSSKVLAEEKAQKLAKIRKRIASKKEEAEDELSIEELEALEKDLLAE